MWVFLSSRLRNWLLLAVVLPVAGSTVHKLAESRRQRSPDARTTRLLGLADSGLVKVNSRLSRRRGKSVATSR